MLLIINNGIGFAVEREEDGLAQPILSFTGLSVRNGSTRGDR